MILVEGDHRDVAHVGVDGVAEEEKLHHRQGHHHRHGEPIATHLMELFPGDDPEAKRHAAPRSCRRWPSSRTIETKASSTVTRLSRKFVMERPSGPRVAAATVRGSA